MKIKINSILLTVFFMLYAFLAYAQKGPPLPGPPPSPPGLPVDAGLSFLIAIGVAFGVFKLRKKN